MPPSFLLRVLEEVYCIVEDLGVSPVVAGGLAVSYWGHPRSTQDIDLAILAFDLAFFESRLRRQKIQISPFRNVDLGFVKISQWKVYLDLGIDCEVDFLISNSSYHQAAISNAPLCKLTGIEKPLRILRCEDLILFKACAGRLIDLADIRTLVELNPNLNFDYLRAKSHELQLTQEFWLSK